MHDLWNSSRAIPVIERMHAIDTDEENALNSVSSIEVTSAALGIHWQQQYVTATMVATAILLKLSKCFPSSEKILSLDALANDTRVNFLLQDCVEPVS
jgi:hypothetical protein